MQISGASPPLHIARAYQLQQMQSAQRAAGPHQTESAAPMQQVPNAAASRGVDSLSFTRPVSTSTSVASTSHIHDVKPPLAPAFSAQLDAVIGARVDRAVEFGQSAMTGTPVHERAGHALPMYTRAADRIEAGTAMHVGRSVDFRA